MALWNRKIHSPNSLPSFLSSMMDLNCNVKPFHIWMMIEPAAQPRPRNLVQVPQKERSMNSVTRDEGFFGCCSFIEHMPLCVGTGQQFKSYCQSDNSRKASPWWNGPLNREAPYRPNQEKCGLFCHIHKIRECCRLNLHCAAAPAFLEWRWCIYCPDCH